VEGYDADDMNSTKRSVKAIIFDLDGTLADTFPMIVAAWNAAVSPHTGKKYSDTEVIARFGNPDPQMIREALTGDAADEADRVYHAYYAANHDAVKPFDGISELLSELRRRGIPLGLMTGKGRRSAKITLTKLGWADVFGAVVTGEDVTKQKPEPDGPLLAARTLGVSPKDCAFIGDSPADIGAAQAAGMVSVAAGWHSVYVEKIRAMRPDVWAEAPADVLQLLSPLPPGQG
jgi:2-phosphoglycolate phosphatase